MVFIANSYGRQSQQAIPADSAQSALDAPVQFYSLDAANALSAVLKIANDFELAMGIEWITTDNASRPFTRSWQKTTVMAMLRDILNSVGEYEVTTSQARPVVHIRPVILRSDSGDIVNARIGAFAVKDEYVRMASRRLEELANGVMVPPDPQAGGVGGSTTTGLGDRRISFAVKDATVMDILDQLCLAADLRIWIVAYPAVQTRTATGFLRTAALFADGRVVDDWEQPVWTFHTWTKLINR
jgi:hypothetical protein